MFTRQSFFAITGLLTLSATLLLARPAAAQLQAEFGLMGGFATAPYSYDDGWYYASFIDLPLRAHEGTGVLQGEILVGLAGSDDNEEILTTALLDQQAVETDQRQLSILFGLKYRFDLGARLKPYVVLGPGVIVNLNDPDPLVAGQVPVAPELEARGIQTGQGFFLAAGHVGGGVELYLTPGLSVGIDVRGIFQEDTNNDYTTAGGRLAFHF